MICAHFRAHTIALDTAGRMNVPAETGDCGLMLESAEQRLAVHAALAASGFACNPAVTDCPVANGNRWAECPYYKRG